MSATEGEMSRAEHAAIMFLTVLLAGGLIAYVVIVCVTDQPRLVHLLMLMVGVAAGLASLELRYLIRRRHLSGKQYTRYDQIMPIAVATFAINYAVLFLITLA